MTRVKGRDLPAPVADLVLHFHETQLEPELVAEMLRGLEASRDSKLVAVLAYERLTGKRFSREQLDVVLL